MSLRRVIIRDNWTVPLEAVLHTEADKETTLGEGQALRWQSSDPDLVTVTAERDNPLAARAAARGIPGVVQVTAELLNPDMNPDTDEPPLIAIFHLVVEPSRAVRVSIRCGTPYETEEGKGGEYHA